MSNADYTLIQLSDTHLLGEGLAYGSVDTTARLKESLDAILASGLKPDALILSGDLTDHGAPAAYEKLRELVLPVVAELETELIVLAGNHDDAATLTKLLLDGGEHDRVHQIGGLRVITLDSSVAGHHHGEIGDDQLRWLAAQLEQPAPDGTILAVHHPPLPSTMSALDIAHLREPGRLAEAIAGTDVRLVICGHNHTISAGAAGGVPVWVAPAVAYSIDPLLGNGGIRAVREGGFTRIDVFDGSPVASYVPIGYGEPIFSYSADQLEELAAQYA